MFEKRQSSDMDCVVEVSGRIESKLKGWDERKQKGFFWGIL